MNTGTRNTRPHRVATALARRVGGERVVVAHRRDIPVARMRGDFGAIAGRASHSVRQRPSLLIPPPMRSAATPWRILVFVALLACPAAPAGAQELIPATAGGWSAFAPRPETMPAVSTSASGAGYRLEISGNGVHNVYGGWRTRISGLQGGARYRFRARAVPIQIASPREAVTIVLRWRGSFGDEVVPDYVWNYRLLQDESLAFDRVIQAPAGTTAVDVELILQWAPNGAVAFDGLSFTPAAAPPARNVRVAAVHYRPSGTTSGQDSVQRAAQYGEQVAAAHRPDVMVFGELLNVIGAPGTYESKAETVPGPSTDVMAGLARGHNTYVVVGLLEREGRVLYNTAVLIDRHGNIAGKYRKVQLPLSEAGAGITPGDRVPVFDTDFGRVALLICQDLSFPEPSREAAVQGAEMLLVPIWGGKTGLVHARAVEQSMYIAASGYDYHSEVVHPLGAALDAVKTLDSPGAAVATIDLQQHFRETWLGNWRDISNKERRTSPYTADAVPPGGGEPLPPPPPPPTDHTPPTVSIQSPSPGVTVSGPINVTASASDNVGVSAVRFFVDGVQLGADDTSAPYAAAWDTRAVSNGAHTVSATAYDAAGNSMSASVSVNVANSAPPPASSSPYSGTPISLPGRIEAEHFDNGGANVAYVDNSAGNSGGVFRQTDVDIQATSDTGGGYNVGWMGAGEWLAYTVNVSAAGTYTLRARVAAAGSGGTFHVESNGIARTGSLTIPNTGAWQNWATIATTITLPAGQQVLRLVLDANGSDGVFGNLNWMEVVATPASTPFSGTPVGLPGRIQAEDFDSGGANVAYVDTSAGNSGGAYRQTDVDIEATTDAGGGYNVGWMSAGEWLHYSVNVSAAGTYTLRVRVAAAGTGGRFHIESNGVDRTGPMTIPNTGGWQVWTTISATVTLPAGQQVLRVVADADGSTGIFGNINWIEVVSSSMAMRLDAVRETPVGPVEAAFTVPSTPAADRPFWSFPSLIARGSPSRSRAVGADDCS